MQYLGGKSRGAKQIAEWVNATRDAGKPFWDPFCGGLSVSLALGGAGMISDANPALMSLYCAVRDGWDPPSSVSLQEYQEAKQLPDSDPFKAFAGFACSFGGKWFGGYARSGTRNFAEGARRCLKRDIETLVLRGCTFECINFLDVEPYDIGCTLYLDPPYRGTTGYRMPFDVERFDRQVLRWATFTDVFVSEYSFPHGVEVLRFNKPLAVCGGQSNNPNDEKLFYLGSAA